MNLVPPWSGCKGYRVKRLAAALLLVLVAAASHPALMAQTPAPVIEKLKPTSGSVGTNVKIKGSNFGTSPGTVTFNGTNAPLNPSSNWESEKIQARVPEGATTGRVVVVVTTAGGQSSNSVAFEVTSAPTGPNISKLEPDSAPVGTEIKIKGSNFGTSGSVTFNGTAASTNGWNDKKIQAVVPSTATDGPVVVTVDGESSNGVTFDVTAGVPTISKLEPDSGPVLTQVNIKGSNFGAQEGTVTFNGVTHDPSRWNHNIIHAQVPQGATTGPVVVTTSAGRSSAGVTFTVPPSASRPIISRLDPNSGLVDASVTIEGSNFGTSSGTVTFNGTTASTTSWASDEIQTSVPSGATSGPVVVRTSGGQSSAGVTFTVTLPAPVISRLDPNSGLVDASVTIEGSNFGTILGNRHLQRNHRFDHQLGRRRDSDKRAVWGHFRAGGGEDLRWAVERRSHLHRDPPCAGHLPAGPQFGTRELLGHHRGFQFRDILGNRHLQRNHRFDHQLGQRRDSDKGAVRGHHRAGGGEDLRWTVEHWSLQGCRQGPPPGRWW